MIVAFVFEMNENVTSERERKIYTKNCWDEPSIYNAATDAVTRATIITGENHNHIAHYMEASSTHSYAQNKTPSFQTNNSKQSTQTLPFDDIENCAVLLNTSH